MFNQRQTMKMMIYNKITSFCFIFIKLFDIFDNFAMLQNFFLRQDCQKIGTCVKVQHSGSPSEIRMKITFLFQELFIFF